MVNGLERALRAARKAQESMYTGTAAVTERRKERDEKTKLSREEDVVVLQDIPCRLSFETLKSVQQTDTAAGTAQAVKLFLSPDVTVKAGSKITVTQDGVTREYACSGIPAVYPTHQEILLELFERWA